MLLTEYLREISGTEREKEFMQQLDTPEMEAVYPTLVKLPFIGKMAAALGELTESESIAAFEASPNYAHLEGWDIIVHPETGHFSFMPGAAKRKKALVIVGIVAAVIIGLIVWRKIRKKYK